MFCAAWFLPPRDFRGVEIFENTSNAEKKVGCCGADELMTDNLSWFLGGWRRRGGPNTSISVDTPCPLERDASVHIHAHHPSVLREVLSQDGSSDQRA